ncbi:hypothetical protein [Cardiobacterium valvarum]|uniref:hypothetical protein n=1 Tax=Cardiobacterium valvarum TaxID=194702 RepID=UPI0035E7E3B0
MNGCAAALLYFVIILPASIALDFAFGTEGMLTVLGLIFGFCWLVARGNKAQQDDSAGAPDQPPLVLRLWQRPRRPAQRR